MGGAPSNMGGNTTVLELTNCDDDEYNADDMLDMLEGFDDELLFKQPCKDLNRIIRQSDDAPWILSAAFMILTMQSGFAMLEKGYLDPKHSVNTMVKNVVDIVVGGAMFWILGYGIAFGGDISGNANAFMGKDMFLFEPDKRIKEDFTYKNDDNGDDTKFQEGDRNLVLQTELYSSWIFHFAFASTATTIVSGSVAGRMKMSSYTIWAFFAPMFYAFVAHWVWGKKGWLKNMGFTDLAGCGPVHLFGACGSLSGILMVGPRVDRFTKPADGEESKYKEIYEPEAVIQGTLILWWGWIGFNCGSTFGTTGTQGAHAVRIGVVTVVATIFGALTELIKIFLPTAKARVQTATNFMGHQIEESKLGAALLKRGVSVKFNRGVSMKTWRQSSMPTDEEVTEAMQAVQEQQAKMAKEQQRASARENKEEDVEEGDGPVGRGRTRSIGDRIHRDSIVKMTKRVFEVADNRIKVPALTNAILAALVSSTAPCDCVTPRQAVLIGAIAPFIADWANKKVASLKLDDPCGAIGVHGACGIWGLLCCGLFSTKRLPGVDKDGFFVSWDWEGAHYLGVQLLGAVCIVSWGICTNLLLFNTVQRLTGGLRVDIVTEERGIDEADHSTMTMEAKLIRQLAEKRASSRSESNAAARDSYRENFNPMGVHEESSMLDVMFAPGAGIGIPVNRPRKPTDGTDNEIEMNSNVRPHVSFDMESVDTNGP